MCMFETFDTSRICAGSSLQVIKSEYIDAQRILLVVPLEDVRFLEVRALLLEHLGRHQEALECAPGLLL